MVRAVAEGISLCGGLLGKGLQIRDGKGEVGQIRADLHRSAGIVLADLDLLVALRCLEKHKLGTPSAFAAPSFLKP